MHHFMKFFKFFRFQSHEVSKYMVVWLKAFKHSDSLIQESTFALGKNTLSQVCFPIIVRLIAYLDKTHV